MEFLGDSILEFISSKYIFKNYPNLKEGEMTKVRAQVVCEQSLYKIAKMHNFSDFLNLGKSEKLSGGKERPAILADSVEAVIAAMYIDGGLKVAEKFIIENLKNKNIHSILDLGCGTGALLKEIKELNIAEQLFGIDISPNMIELATKHVGQKDYKTVLQEKLQIHGDVKIEYILLNESGPDHDKRFEMEVRCNGKKLAVGTGKSKKLAQMDAAHNAIESL